MSTGPSFEVAPERTERSAGRRWWVRALAVPAGFMALVGAAHVAAGIGVVCPWRAVTGLDCPGCGSGRALRALARGDLVTAADHNLMVVLVAGAATLWWGAAVIRRDVRVPALGRWGPMAALVTIIAWSVARNLDVWFFHSSAI